MKDVQQPWRVQRILVHRNRREASKLVLLHGATRFQLALVSQWTVATILGLHSRDGTGRQKDKVYDAFGCFGCTQKLGAQSQGVCWLSHTVQSLVCKFRCPEIASELVRAIFAFFDLFLFIILARNIECQSILQKTFKQFGLVASKYERKSRHKSNFQCISLLRRVCLCPVMSRDVSPKCISVWLFTVETLSFPPEIQLGICFTSWRTQIYQLPR